MFKIFFVCTLFLVVCSVHGQEACDGLTPESLTHALDTARNLCPILAHDYIGGHNYLCGNFQVKTLRTVSSYMKDSCQKLTQQLGS